MTSMGPHYVRPPQPAHNKCSSRGPSHRPCDPGPGPRPCHAAPTRTHARTDAEANHPLCGRVGDRVQRPAGCLVRPVHRVLRLLIVQALVDVRLWALVLFPWAIHAERLAVPLLRQSAHAARDAMGGDGVRSRAVLAVRGWQAGCGTAATAQQQRCRIGTAARRSPRVAAAPTGGPACGEDGVPVPSGRACGPTDATRSRSLA